jgi:hypothetical protein
MRREYLEEKTGEATTSHKALEHLETIIYYILENIFKDFYEDFFSAFRWSDGKIIILFD